MKNHWNESLATLADEELLISPVQTCFGRTRWIVRMKMPEKMKSTSRAKLGIHILPTL